jgi:hypothetical protein
MTSSSGRSPPKKKRVTGKSGVAPGSDRRAGEGGGVAGERASRRTREHGGRVAAGTGTRTRARTGRGRGLGQGHGQRHGDGGGDKDTDKDSVTA